MWLFVSWEVFINILCGLSSEKELFLARHVGPYKWWMPKAQKKYGKRPRDKSLVALGGEQGWGFCIAELFPTRWTLVMCLCCCTFWKEISIPKQGSFCVWICALPMCFSIFSLNFSEAMLAGDSHILPDASPGSSLSPASPTVPTPCELTAPSVTPS